MGWELIIGVTILLVFIFSPVSSSPMNYTCDTRDEKAKRRKEMEELK